MYFSILQKWEIQIYLPIILTKKGSNAAHTSCISIKMILLMSKHTFQSIHTRTHVCHLLATIHSTQTHCTSSSKWYLWSAITHTSMQTWKLHFWYISDCRLHTYKPSPRQKWYFRVYHSVNTYTHTTFHSQDTSYVQFRAHLNTNTRLCPHKCLFWFINQSIQHRQDALTITHSHKNYTSNVQLQTLHINNASDVQFTAWIHMITLR